MSDVRLVFRLGARQLRFLAVFILLVLDCVEVLSPYFTVFWSFLGLLDDIEAFPFFCFLSHFDQRSYLRFAVDYFYFELFSGFASFSIVVVVTGSKGWELFRVECFFSEGKTHFGQFFSKGSVEIPLHATILEVRLFFDGGPFWSNFEVPSSPGIEVVLTEEIGMIMLPTGDFRGAALSSMLFRSAFKIVGELNESLSCVFFCVWSVGHSLWFRIGR